MRLPFELMIKMTIPQIRYLLSLGLRTERQLWPDYVAADDDKVGDDQMIYGRDQPDAMSVRAREKSDGATDDGPSTLAPESDQID